MVDIETRYRQMYEFEDNSQLYAFRFKDTGIPMWMYIRSDFINNVVDRETWNQYRQEWIGNGTINKKSIFQKYVTKNPFLSHQKDILFAFWGYSELHEHNNGLVYEDFIMPFFKMFPDNTTTLMDGNVKNEYELNCAHPNWKMDDIFKDILRISGYLKGNKDISNEDKKNIRGLINFLMHNCPLQIDKDLRSQVICILENFSRNSRYMIKICETYLKIIKPKVVIICCASYPSLLITAMVLACRNRKIITAELQHGLISIYHVNYCYCDYILNNSECAKLLPDYYLTYGRYWNSIVKIPQKCKVIGYARPVINRMIPNNNKILFCADIDFDRYIDFLDKILSKLDIEIYFRFHPRYSSKKQRNKFKKYLKYLNFSEANEKDLSFYMRNCRYVIADGGTVCFEALFMRRIVFSFIGKSSIKTGINSLSDVHLINSADDFINLWYERDKLQPKCHDEFFDLDYKKNYVNFLRNIV